MEKEQTLLRAGKEGGGHIVVLGAFNVIGMRQCDLDVPERQNRNVKQKI